MKSVHKFLLPNKPYRTKKQLNGKWVLFFFETNERITKHVQALNGSTPEDTL